jgi:hypothetical protein
MTLDVQDKFVKELDDTTQLYDKEYTIFDGGCAWVAYVLSSILERAKVPYTVTLFVQPKYRHLDMFKLAQKDLIAHIGITVDYKNRKLIIGGDFTDTYRHYGVGSYEIPNITSEDLKNLYENNSWNPGYDNVEQVNSDYKDDMETIFIDYSNL